MSNQNSYLVLRLTSKSTQSLAEFAQAISSDPTVLLSSNSGGAKNANGNAENSNPENTLSFDPMLPDDVHITFTFFGEALYKSADKDCIEALYVEVQRFVETFGGEGLGAKESDHDAGADGAEHDKNVASPDSRLEISSLDFFPPGKSNLIVTHLRFVDKVVELRFRRLYIALHRILWDRGVKVAGGIEFASRSSGRSNDSGSNANSSAAADSTSTTRHSALFEPTLRDDEILELSQAWQPHVTLGKIRASKTQLATLTLSRLQEKLAANPLNLRVTGLNMGGVPPKRLWKDWEGLIFSGSGDHDGEEVEEEILKKNDIIDEDGDGHGTINGNVDANTNAANPSSSTSSTSSNNVIFFAAVGDVHGQFSVWIRHLQNFETTILLPQTKQRLSFVLQVGDIETHRDFNDIATMAAPQSKRDHIGDYGEVLYKSCIQSGNHNDPGNCNSSLNWPTYFIGGNHECYGYLDALLVKEYSAGSCFDYTGSTSESLENNINCRGPPYTLVPNLHYLGRAGIMSLRVPVVVRANSDHVILNIAYLSGILREQDYYSRRPAVSQFGKESNKKWIGFNCFDVETILSDTVLVGSADAGNESEETPLYGKESDRTRRNLLLERTLSTEEREERRRFVAKVFREFDTESVLEWSGIVAEAPNETKSAVVEAVEESSKVEKASKLDERQSSGTGQVEDVEDENKNSVDSEKSEVSGQEVAAAPQDKTPAAATVTPAVKVDEADTASSERQEQTQNEAKPTNDVKEDKNSSKTSDSKTPPELRPGATFTSSFFLVSTLYAFMRVLELRLHGVIGVNSEAADEASDSDRLQESIQICRDSGNDDASFLRTLGKTTSVSAFLHQMIARLHASGNSKANERGTYPLSCGELDAVIRCMLGTQADRLAEKKSRAMRIRLQAAFREDNLGVADFSSDENTTDSENLNDGGNVHERATMDFLLRYFTVKVFGAVLKPFAKGGSTSQKVKQQSLTISPAKKSFILLHLSRFLNKISREAICDILITHDWPSGMVPANVVNKGSRPMGNHVAAQLVNELRPQFLFCGHMHRPKRYRWVHNVNSEGEDDGKKGPRVSGEKKDGKQEGKKEEKKEQAKEEENPEEKTETEGKKHEKDKKEEKKKEETNKTSHTNVCCLSKVGRHGAISIFMLDVNSGEISEVKMDAEKKIIFGSDNMIINEARGNFEDAENINDNGDENDVGNDSGGDDSSSDSGSGSDKE